MILEIIIMGNPVPQPRHQISTLGGVPRAYIKASHPIHAYKAAIREEFRGQYKGFEPLTGPLEVELNFVFPRPENLVWKKKPMLRLWHSKASCDYDNVAKAVGDALEGLAYNNDGQIAKATVTKQIAEGKEDPHTRVVIRALTDVQSPPSNYD